jgi:hypothetical protein
MGDIANDCARAQASLCSTASSWFEPPGRSARAFRRGTCQPTHDPATTASRSRDWRRSTTLSRQRATVRHHEPSGPCPHPTSTLTLTPCRTHTVHNSIHHASCHVHIPTARMNRRALVQGHPRVGHLSSSRHAHSHTRTCTRTRTPTHSDEIPAGEGG